MLLRIGRAAVENAMGCAGIARPASPTRFPHAAPSDKAHGDRDYGVKAVEALPGRDPSGSRILPAGLSTGGGFTYWRGFTSLVSRFKVNTGRQEQNDSEV
jgi:hypothetical protein